MQHTATAPSPTDRADTWEATYAGTVDQVRRVRAELRPLLHDCPIADEVILLISELSANAVLHSDSRQPGGTFTVRLQHIRGDHVRAEVQDQGGTWDGDLARSARYPHGLYLLLALSSRCGIEHGTRSRTCGSASITRHILRATARSPLPRNRRAFPRKHPSASRLPLPPGGP